MLPFKRTALIPTGLNSETRWLLWLFLITALGGALRKWFVSSSALSNIILGVQMVIPFLMVARRSARSYSPFARYQLLAIYFVYLAFHIVYPLQQTIYHGIFGMLIHGGFWLGIFFYLSNRHLFQMEKLMPLIIAVVALEIVLAFIQYQLPQGHFLNKYAREGQTIAVVGSRVRVTGTFSYLSGYTAFMLFYPLFVWSLVRLRYPQWLVVTAAAFGTIACFMTGSRSALVIFLLLMVPVILREYPLSSLFRLAGRLILPAMVAGAVLLVAGKIQIAKVAQEAYDNFMQRVEANRRSGEQNARIYTDLWYIQNAHYQYPLTGVGLGSTYQGAVQLFGVSRHVQEFGYAESELSRVLLEGGWIIVLLKLALGLLMARQLAFTGFMRWAVWFTIAFGQPIVFNPHNAAFLMMGIMLADNVIWREQQHKRKLLWAAAQRQKPAAHLPPNTPVLKPGQA